MYVYCITKDFPSRRIKLFLAGKMEQSQKSDLF